MRFEFSTLECSDFEYCEFDLNMIRTKVSDPYLVEFQSYVTGDHIYKDIGITILAYKLATTTKAENLDDKVW